MGLLIMAGLHVLHLVLCSLIEVVIPRYESLTYEVLLAAALIATGAGLRGFRRATPSLHR
jgi:hypothetical protein